MAAEEKGLIIEFIEEQEVKAGYGLKNPEVTSKGKIIIRNLTGGAISDLQLTLQNTENVNIEKELFLGSIRDEDTKTIEYNITTEKLGLSVIENLTFPPEIPSPFALRCEPIEIQSTLGATNELDAPALLTVKKELHKQFKAPTEVTPPSGEYITMEDAIVWRDAKINAGEKVELPVNLKMHPEDIEAFNTGKITYEWTCEGTTLSGLRFGKLTGLPKVTERILSEERKETPGIWDISMVITNASHAPISVGATIEIREGEVLTEAEGGHKIKGSIERRAPGIRIFDIVKLAPVRVEPGQTATLGPVTIRNPAKPKVVQEFHYEIHPIVRYSIKARGEIGDIKIPVVWGEISRKISVKHEEYYAGLAENQIAAHAEEKIESETVIENLGSAGIDEIIVRDIIPEDIAPPTPGNVQVFISKRGETRLPPELIEIKIEPEGSLPEEQNTLVIKISNISYYFDEPLNPGEKIWIRYTTTSIDPKEDKVYEFGSSAEITMIPGAKARLISVKEPPKLTGILARRLITVEKDVEPLEEGRFKVMLSLTNESQISIPIHVITDRVPTTFEFDERSANPKPKSIEVTPEGAVLCRWEISLKPGERKTITYEVKARSPEARVKDLKLLYEE
ncbi:MAG: hypothetical protein QXH55_03165 [Candidatus Korarchaeota archaeon]|nr:DUF4139 domain-containing protein [Thermoproteota archaeon]MCR8471830.1 DUF4139 domain-containing protein [Thermoproteota archaeon]